MVCLCYLSVVVSQELSSQVDVIDAKDTMVSYEASRQRLHWIIGGGAVAYAASSYALYQTWYRDFPQSGFHLHNDWGEWRHMDKLGHVYSTYFQADLAYQGFRWAGQSDKKAMWYGAATAMLFQSTIEVMDGFSTEWGFSLSDIGANVLGAGSLVAQQGLWGEQRMRWKNSYSPVTYDPILDPRVDQLYGTSIAQRWLKDYNGQTYWLSINADAFLPEAGFPSWLNLAIGYGADNMLGGYENDFGDIIGIDESRYPRYSQFYISLDADLSKIDTDSPFLRTILDLLNILKMPFSTLEINTRGEVQFHLLRF